MQIAASHKAIAAYYAELENYTALHATYEQATRAAFQKLLSAFAHPAAGWTLILEQPLANGKRPDGTLRDAFNLPRGYWEAKDTGDDLDVEITKKIKAGYPTTNTIFEDTRRAVLYQSGTKRYDLDLTKKQELADLLNTFFGYTEPHIEGFEQAVKEFKERIPELAKGLREVIVREHRPENRAFYDAFEAFKALCAESLDPQIKAEALYDMLVQHLLTERLFRTVFNNADFTRRNVIAAEIEKVIAALTSRAFDRTEFLRQLDRFYIAIEAAARGLTEWSEKQTFLNMVYERFFQGYSVKGADTHGIVYTPQEIVDFMCASVEEVLRREFHTSIGEPGVQILDPCTGTGNFVVNLLRRIGQTAPQNLREKYAKDLFANEVMLLPYYIAAMNIEHEFYAQTNEYQAFDGLCFVDTLELAERVAHAGLGERSLWMTERNAERVEREKDAKIMVVIGNPPYNVGQMSENDNNKNRPYSVVDSRIRATYSKDSKATLNNKLYDAYVRFFRWASDRLQGRDGIVCFVSNNSFVDQIAFDGMRKHLLQDFTHIYHLDLHGNVRQNPSLSGTTHNVFGIQVGVGITIAVRATRGTEQGLLYYRVPEDWRREQKLSLLAEIGDMDQVEWQELLPDERHTWITEGLRPEYGNFLPTGTKATKSSVSDSAAAIFKSYSLGVGTNRDEWVYDFDSEHLTQKIRSLIKNYNGEVFRWSQEELTSDKVDEFVNNDPHFIKWTDRLKGALLRNQMLRFDAAQIRRSATRPFCKQYLYFDPLLNQRRYQQHLIFPTASSEQENIAIWLKTGSEWPAFAFVSNVIPILLPQGGGQCFPLYTYDEDGSNRRENVTDWALGQFRARYGDAVTKRDIFDYVYGLLHHPQYRERYAENLKRELPRIPLLPTRAEYDATRAAGAALAALHLGYETAQEYPLTWRFTPGMPQDWRVKKMKLIAEKTAVVYNDWLTLEGVPPEAFAYRLGNRSALEWVIDQYQVSTDARSSIVSDPNRAGSDEERQYIARLVGRVLTVSVETVRLVRNLAAQVDLLAAVGAADAVTVTAGGRPPDAPTVL